MNRAAVIRYRQHHGRLLAVLFCFVSGSAPAAEVFRSIDEDGVVTFSDVETADAERVELPPAVIREEAFAEQQALIDQQLEVAQALEASRLAREAARTERLEARAANEPRTVYYRESDQARYDDDWGYWGGGYWPGGYRPGHRPHPRPPWRPGFPDGPVHPIEPPPGGMPPASRRVPLPPLKPR